MNCSVDVNSTPLITESEIIFGTAANGVIALDKQTLEEKWNFKTNPALIYTSPYSKPSSSTVETSPVLVGDTIFFGASDGILYALNRIMVNCCGNIKQVCLYFLQYLLRETLCM